MDLYRLRSAIRTSKKKTGVFSFSVWSFPTLYADEIVRASRALNDGDPPHRKMQTATVRAISDTGCDLVRTAPDRHGHYSVVFESMPTETELRATMDVFGAARLTPSHRR